MTRSRIKGIAAACALIMSSTIIGANMRCAIAAEPDGAGSNLPTVDKSREVDVSMIIYSPNGRNIAAGMSDGKLAICRAEDGERLRTIACGGGFIADAAFSPDGEEIVVASESLPPSVWSTRTGAEALRLHGAAKCGSVAFSPDGKELAAQCWADGSLQLWSQSTGEMVHSLPPGISRVGTGNGLRPVRFPIGYGKEGRQVMFVYEQTILLSDARSGAKVRSIDPGAIACAAYGSRDSLVIALDVIGLAKSYDMETGKEMQRIRLGEGVSCMAISPDSTILAVGSREGRTDVWELHPLRKRWSFTGNGYVSSMSFAPDGKTIAIASHSSAVIRSVLSGQLMRTLDVVAK